MSTDAIPHRKERLRPPLLLARLAATALYLSLLSAFAAQRTVILDAGDETYKVTFDSARVPEIKVREWVLLSPYTILPFSTEFEMAGSRSLENGIVKVDKIFYAPSLERCRTPGCAERALDVTDAWIANAAKNLDRGRKQVARLAAMQLPEELEPVRAYLAGWLQFTLSLQETRFAYIKSSNQRPMQENMFANCESSQIGDAQMFSELTAAPISARVEASNRWYGRMSRCYGEKRSYPMGAWNAFLAKYGLHEETIFNDPDSK